MSCERNDRRVVVLGLGNLLFGDEGFGIAALQAVQNNLGQLPGVEYVDGGVLGLGLLPLIENCTHLLALDAIDAGAEPGSLIEVDGKQLPMLNLPKLSEHQVGFQEVLALSSFRETLPEEVRVLAVQPGDLEAGVALSQVVEQALPEIVQRARSTLGNWVG